MKIPWDISIQTVTTVEQKSTRFTQPDFGQTDKKDWLPERSRLSI